MSHPVQEDRQPHIGRAVSTGVLVVLVVLLAILLAAVGRHVWHYFRSPAELRELVQHWGVWAPAGTVLFQMLQIVVAPLPGSVMSFACGYALGLWPTIVWLMAGVALGATIDFALARLLGRRLLRHLVPPDKLARLDDVIVRRGAFYVFLLLLVPNPLGDWIYYLAGLTPIPFPLFLVFVLAARLPSNLLECGLGSSATRFGVREWLLLGALVTLATLLYLFNQRRIDSFLERLARRGESRERVSP